MDTHDTALALPRNFDQRCPRTFEQCHPRAGRAALHPNPVARSCALLAAAARSRVRPRLRAGADAEDIVDAGLRRQHRAHARRADVRSDVQSSAPNAYTAAAAAVPAAVAAATGGGKGGGKKSARLQLSEAIAPSCTSKCLDRPPNLSVKRPAVTDRRGFKSEAATSTGATCTYRYHGTGPAR